MARGTDSVCRRDGLVPGVLVVVDEDSNPLLLPPFGGDQTLHPPLQLPGKGEDGPPGLKEVPDRLDPHIHVYSAAPRCLGPADQAQFVEQILGTSHCLSHSVEGDPRRRVEVKAELIGVVDVLCPHWPGVEVETSELGKPNHIRFGPGHVHAPRTLRRESDLDRVERSVLGGALVIDRVDGHVLHVPLEHCGPAADPSDCPRRHPDEMPDHIELGPAPLRKHHPRRARDAHILTTHSDRGVVRHANLKLSCSYMACRTLGRSKEGPSKWT